MSETGLRGMKTASVILPHTPECSLPSIETSDGKLVNGSLRPTKGTNFKVAKTSLDRFREKCIFDPDTGCVLWNGGLTRGGQKESNCLYGVFWDNGRRHSAHRWACENVHGKPIPEGWHAGHTCPTGPDSLCVQHVEPQSPNENWKLRHDPGAADRSLERRRVIAEGRAGGVPFFTEPAWLSGKQESDDDSCPF